jgi:ferredoxin
MWRVKMRITVDQDRCAGHARCAHVAPAVYQLDETGYNRMVPFTVPKELEDSARAGAEACPERAINEES